MWEIRKLFRQYQGLIISVLILIGVGAGVVFGLIPAVGKVMSIRSESQEISEYVMKLGEKVSILEAIDESTYQRLLTELSLAVPPDKSFTSLFATIDGLSAMTGVSVLDVVLTRPGALATDSARRQSAEEQKVGSNLLPFTITIAGSYLQIRDFLERAVNVRRFFRVHNFDIALINESTITVKLGLDAFFAPLPNNLGSVEQPITPLSSTDEQVIALVTSLPVVGQDISLTIPEGTPLPSSTSFRDNPFEP